MENFIRPLADPRDRISEMSSHINATHPLFSLHKGSPSIKHLVYRLEGRLAQPSFSWLWPRILSLSTEARRFFGVIPFKGQEMVLQRLQNLLRFLIELLWGPTPQSRSSNSFCRCDQLNSNITSCFNGLHVYDFSLDIHAPPSLSSHHSPKWMLNVISIGEMCLVELNLINNTIDVIFS